MILFNSLNFMFQVHNLSKLIKLITLATINLVQ